MPDKRRHRGAHPEDEELFAPSQWPNLRTAVAELSWLLSRDYALPSSLKLVGDRYDLTERQRTAVMRCACSDSSMKSRLSRQVGPEALKDIAVCIDGYNLLTTIETALAGGVVLIGRDTAWRDMASIHGTWRKVEETQPALQLVGQALVSLDAGRCTWFLDKPVSNSGRLAQIMREIASQEGWNWHVEIVVNPDKTLLESPDLIVTADSVILDQCRNWLNMVRPIIRERIPSANVVDMNASPPPG